MVATRRLSDKPTLIELAKSLERLVRDGAAQGTPLVDVERQVLASVLKMGRAAMNLFVRSQGDGDLGKTLSTAEGETLHRSEQPRRRELRTVFGPIEFRAFVYLAAPERQHGAVALRPIDARMGLSDRGTSYLYEELSQVFCVEQAFGGAASAMKKILGHSASVDTLESVSRTMGPRAAEFLDSLPVPPAKEEGQILVLSADGKGVPLVKADAQRIAAGDEDDQRRPGNRRMATVVSVYSVDPYVRTAEEVVAALFRERSDEKQQPKRPTPSHKRVRACFPKVYEQGTPDEATAAGPIEAFSWADRELTGRLRPGQRPVLLMDGQRSLWEMSADCLSGEERIEILDILHVSTYVWIAAKLFHSGEQRREEFVRDRLLRILQGNAAGVIKGLRRMGTEHRLRGERARSLERVCGYLARNLGRMRYDEYLRAGYPIASGVIEGACRHLVKDRMERSGMRWTLDGAQAMLDVRAIWQSDEWDHFHAERIRDEQQNMHPHRDLLTGYTPALAA